MMKFPTHQIFHIERGSDKGYSNWKTALEKTGVNTKSVQGELLIEQISHFFLDNYPLTLLVERNYTDKDFRSLYYRHYSKVYREIDRYSVRCHVFSGWISADKLLPPSEISDENYEGYFCLSLLEKPLLGRTILNYQFKNNRDFLCRTEFEARVFGCKLNVIGFPFIWQDGEVIRCAHASLWMIHRYFSTRYPNYKESLPHEILWSGEMPWRRLVPSTGLSVEELGAIFSQLGYHPEVVNREIIKKEFGPDAFFQILHAYIESRIPVIACSYELRHAVVVIGRTAPLKRGKQCKLFDKYGAENKISYWDASDFCSSIIVNDDNYFPYGIWKWKDGSSSENDRTIDHIEYIIVPLYEKIFLSAPLAKFYGLQALSHPVFGIKSSSEKPFGESISNLIDLNEPFVIRTLLTSSRTYLRYLKETLPQNATAHLIRRLSLPKFVWLIEVATHQSFFENIKVEGTQGELTGKKVAEVVLDATIGNETDFDAAWFFIRYPGIIVFNEKFVGATFPDRIEVSNEGESFPEPILVNSF